MNSCALPIAGPVSAAAETRNVGGKFFSDSPGDARPTPYTSTR